MLSDQRLRIAWRAYFAERLARQLAEHPSPDIVAEWERIYLRNRLEEAMKTLCVDSSLLAEVLIEVLEIATEEAEN